MKEHNNRLKAKKLAEYITGQELRIYLARKVKKYVPDLKTVFDGAVGSGQLEQYLGAEKIFGVEIQEESYLTALENYPNADIECKSFFNYNRTDFICDAVVMNPPFSLKFNDLSEVEKANIQAEFDWKKSGVVDDIFVLKSLKYTKRYAFYILFPGVGYRKTEQKFREIVGNNLLELNVIENAFDDTSIPVLFIVIDKEKTDNSIYKEIYDCKLKKEMVSGTFSLEEDFKWEQPRIEKEVEKIDIDEISTEARNSLVKHVDSILQMEEMMYALSGKGYDEILKMLDDITRLCEEFRTKLINGKIEIF